MLVHTLKVALGYGHVIVVTCDTTVYSWGENEHGQLGLGDVQSRREPTLIEGLKGRNIQRFLLISFISNNTISSISNNTIRIAFLISTNFDNFF